jgi:hypothetical protein
MPTKNRIFISFAVEDSTYRDFLVGQARHAKSPFVFVDMSVKAPWDQAWKTNCRSRMKGCDGVIVLVSKNTAKADGALWEIQCAKDEAIPLLGIYCTTDNRPTSTPAGLRVVSWTWENVANFINNL